MGVMCGIDEAVQHIREECAGSLWAEHVINRLDYHRRQAEGVKPKFNAGGGIREYYTCRNCGFRVDVVYDYCPKCGYRIRWDSTRCLTGLPLADMAEGGADYGNGTGKAESGA